MTLHRGSVHYEDAPEGGARFIVRVPLVKPRAPGAKDARDAKDIKEAPVAEAAQLHAVAPSEPQSSKNPTHQASVDL
jgi:hypothetical protein